MSSFPLLRRHNRVLLVASACLIFLTSASFWAVRQRASIRSKDAARASAATGLFLPDKGGISASASTITVNSLSDTVNGSDGLCTLREAITAANSNVASGATAGECAAGSSSGSDSIDATGVNGTINLSSALPKIASNLNIMGPGSGQLTVRRNTSDAYRILDVLSFSVNISGLTVGNGLAPVSAPEAEAHGGGLRNAGNLTMNDVVLTANVAGPADCCGYHKGGAIANFGTLTMTNSSVTNNATGSSASGSQGGLGGGIFNSGTLTMTNCVISGNVTGTGFSSGGNGGGIYNERSITLMNTAIINNRTGQAGSGIGGSGGGIFTTNPPNFSNTLINCTISNNSTGGGGTQGYGGGIENDGNLTIVGSTISVNSGNAAGGILNRNTLKLTNTTVSGNDLDGIQNDGGATSILTNCTVTGNGKYGVYDSNSPSIFRNTLAANNVGADVVGQCTSLGHNLIGAAGSTCFVNGVNGDQIGDGNARLDGKLGPLANNGGPTQTHALLSNSTALDAGDDCVTQAAHCGDSNISQLTTDQRGFSRLVDGPDVDTTATIDIGAYEAQVPLASLPDTSTNEDTQLLVGFDGGDTSTITSVTATSSDSTLVPNDTAHLSVAMAGTTGVVTINPAADLSGATNITVTINRTGGPESKTFLLTVNPVNDAPSFIIATDQMINEDAGAQTVNNYATSISPGPADESGQTLTFQITGNTNAGLFTVAPAISANGTLTYTTAPDVSGIAAITVSLMDNGGTANGGVDTSASQLFNVIVSPVNDPPSFTKGADQTVNEEAAAQTVTNWATAIFRGPADESGQTLAFQVTGNSNAALFSSGPAISSTGTLTYTPAVNAVGSATITINLKDNGGTANGGVDTSAPQAFTITVNSVNDAPSFTKGANQTVNEDAGAQTVNNWATSISAGPADESGQTVTFQVTGNTNVALFSAGPAISSTGTLTYTPAAEAIGSATLTINLKDNGGTASGGVDTSASQTFSITVNAVNDAPSFTKGADQAVNEDAGAQTVVGWATALSRGPSDEAGQTLTFQVTGNNHTALFSTQPAINSAGTLTYTPNANANGSATITINLKDSGGTANGGVDTSASQTFNINVNAVNDAPSFTKGANQTVDEDAGAQTVNNWATAISAGPADESGQTLTFQVTGNTNAALFSAGPAISSTGVLTYTPAADANGSATLTINLKDNGGTGNGGVDTSASPTFTITVNAVNDPPSFTKGADQTVNEDAGAQTVAGWATAISRGPADESAQTLTFQVTNNTNAALFSSGPAISSTGTLTYTPATNANGSATITLNLKDGGAATGGVDTSPSQTFTITVNSVNDAPSFTKGASQTVNEDAGAQTVNNWATGISPGPANESGQTLTFQVTGNTNAALFSAGPAISSNGVLTYTPAADANGTASLTINLKDSGGTANGGVDTSASQTFTISVDAVNDVPSFTKGADQTVNNNAGAQTVANWATALSAGPANESAQTLTFQITNNTNSSLFSSGPAISSTGTLTYTPAANTGGTATITVNLKDNGGTANGGVDTSPSQTFTITVTPTGGFINFSAATYNTTESSGLATVILKRTGDLTGAVTVDYASSGNNALPCATANGIATPKCDFTTALGTVNFAAGEDTRSVNILISQDAFVEGPETFTMVLSNPTGNAALGPISTSTTTIADDATEPSTNPIDDVRNFVRQHYHDFLNREPDPSGWDFWTGQITSCGSDVQCAEVRRIDVSASFFLSIEFQQSGYLVERFYKTGYGDAVGTSNFVSNHLLNVPVVRFNEFLKDTQRIGQGVIVLAPGWEQALENNKQAYALEFVQTSRFTTALPTTLTPTAFVDRLNQNTGGVLSLGERTTVINLFGGAANSSNVTARAQAMRMVADDPDLYNAEFNRAFVLAEYFGYLRRNPNDAPETTLDYTGYDFWLTKLNQFNGNYINAEMVKAFLSSIEYRQRFGP